MSIPTPFNPLGTLGGGREQLPPGYRRLSYIASTKDGGQYINTGVVANAATIWMLDWAPIEESVYVSHGSFVPGGHVDIAYGTDSGPYFSVARAGHVTKRTHEDVIGTRLEVWCDVLNTRCKFGNDGWQQLWVGNLFSQAPMTLFCRNNDNNVPSYKRASRVYRSTIWNGAELVSDLVPALAPDGRPCMFNLAGTGTIAERTHYNAGNNEFVYEQ